MADNTTLPGTGEAIRASQRGGTGPKSQVFQLDINPSGTEQLLDVTAGNALPSSLDELKGVTLDVNSGAKSAGTQRVVIATDQPQLTAKLLVTPDSVALPANQSVNVSQINAATPDMNSGVKSGGTLRVVIATDQPQLTNPTQVYIKADAVNQIWKQVEYSAAQTGTIVWAPASGKKIAITSLDITTGGTTAAIVTLYFGTAADTTYTQGVDQVVFRGEFAPSTTSRPGALMNFATARVAATADHNLHITTSAAIQIYVTVYGYEI